MPTVKFRSRGGGVSMTAVIPEPLRVKQMEAVILKDMQRMAREMKKDYSKTTTTWDTNVTFQYRTEKAQPMTGAMKVDIQVGPKPNTDGARIYGYVDKGTRGPYPIPKVGNTTAKTLYFQWGGKGSYKAKTSPRTLGAKSGGPSGPMVSFKRVMHPGIKHPRKFTETIARRWGQLSRGFASKTMAGVARASGHGRRR